MKNVQEIQAAFSRAVSNVMDEYYAKRDEITAKRTPTEDHFLFTDEQRMTALRNEKMEAASEITERARERYTEAVEAYHEALAKRTNTLRERLFGVEDAGALSRAVVASDAELGAMLEVASRAGNTELARAVFCASEQRGLGDLMNRYFSDVDPEASTLFAEWNEIPDEEVLERQLDGVDVVIPEPDADALMPRATVY